MVINTERLTLIPLDAVELELLIYNQRVLEEKLQIKYDGDVLEGFFKEIVISQLEKVKSDLENYIFHTFILIVRKEDNIAIGSCDFKDVPKDGIVEIGYGLSKIYEKNGYMSEAIYALCQFAFKYEEIKSIIAETENDNIPSQNILKRNGFIKYQEDKTSWWILKRA